jgi:hypothetical protein
MIGAILDHATGRRTSRLTTVCLLASTAPERDACRRVMAAIPLLSPADRP